MDFPGCGDTRRVRAWARCIGVNSMRKHFLRAREHQGLGEVERPVSGPGPLAQVLRDEAQEELEAATEEMIPRQRAVVRARVFEDRSAKEVSAELGIRRERMKKVLYRGLEHLRARWQDDERWELRRVFLEED